MAPAITIKKDLYVLDDSGGGQPVRLGPRPVRVDARELQLPHDEPRPRLPRPARRRARRPTSFERLFSLEPRPMPADAPADLPLDGPLPRPARPTARRSRAIAHARAGESLVIQGPPGTGKSQTITNLDRRLRRPRQARPVRVPEAGGDRRRPRPPPPARPRRARAASSTTRRPTRRRSCRASRARTRRGSPDGPSPQQAEARRRAVLGAARRPPSPRSRRTRRRSPSAAARRGPRLRDAHRAAGRPARRSAGATTCRRTCGGSSRRPPPGGAARPTVDQLAAGARRPRPARSAAGVEPAALRDTGRPATARPRQRLAAAAAARGIGTA